MGIQIRAFDDDQQSVGADMQEMDIYQLLRETRALPKADLIDFFKLLFLKMNVQSKEAVAGILWMSLSSSEQQTFEMPYFGSRWSENSINLAFDNAFVPPLHAVAPRLEMSSPTRNLTMSRYNSHFSSNFSGGSSIPRAIQTRRLSRNTTTAMSDDISITLIDMVSSVISSTMRRLDRSNDDDEQHPTYDNPL
ncbi:hypothetical protein HDV06_005139 [Boothiomyces sp. JEL0866]|nr:hypothetical protein HDV06_005139 [Boothiomyces sp. JEL0866]